MKVDKNLSSTSLYGGGGKLNLPSLISVDVKLNIFNSAAKAFFRVIKNISKCYCHGWLILSYLVFLIFVFVFCKRIYYYVRVYFTGENYIQVKCFVKGRLILFMYFLCLVQCVALIIHELLLGDKEIENKPTAVA